MTSITAWSSSGSLALIVHHYMHSRGNISEEIENKYRINKGVANNYHQGFNMKYVYTLSNKGQIMSCPPLTNTTELLPPPHECY